MCNCCQTPLTEYPLFLCGHIYCQQCLPLIKNITNKATILIGKTVKVEYERSITDHDGYCSGADEYHHTTELITRFYPATQHATLSLDQYALPNEGCPSGSGYCGEGGITYQTLSAEIINDH